MNKEFLINYCAEKTGLSKKKATEAVNAVFEAIHEAIKQHRLCRIIGFGTFSVTKRNARKGRNPRTGQEIQIPEKNIVRFRPGSELSKAAE